MWSNRAIDEDDPSVLDPIRRVVHYVDSVAVCMMTSLLRRAWLVESPEEDITKDEFEIWLRELHSKDRVEDVLSKDMSNIDTPIRKQIIPFWTHVHSDVLHFLHGSSGLVGEMDKREGLALRYPPSTSGQDGKVEASISGKEFETNVLLIPTFMAPGVKVRVTRNKTNEEGQVVEKDVHTFDTETDPFEHCFLRRGFAFNFYVDGEPQKEDGVAAVFAMCTLKLDVQEGEPI